MSSLEPSKGQITATPCGLVTRCDSGILDDCPGQKTCKTFGTAGYCVEPTKDVHVTCTDDCDFLGTHFYYYEVVGFFLGCRNDYKVDMNGDRYINTRMVKYYTETCKQWGRCGFGPGFLGDDHIRTLDSFHSQNDGLLNENKDGSCPKYCEEYLNDFCPDILMRLSNCKFECLKSF